MAAVEARLRMLLVPYEGLLESATIHGIPTLRRPGAGAHDWFAFVKPAAKHVSLFLLPLHTDVGLRASLSPVLARALSGRSTLKFTSLDEVVAAEVATLLARAYGGYAAAR